MSGAYPRVLCSRLLLGLMLLAMLGCGEAASGGGVALTPNTDASPSAPASRASSEAIALFPAPPADPQNSCELYDAIMRSADDLVLFGELILGGADPDAAAAAADAYALAADDWDELTYDLVSTYPGTLDAESAAWAVEALKYGATVPQAVDFLARVIRGEETSQTLNEAATAFADPAAYTTLSPMRGFEEDLCGPR